MRAAVSALLLLVLCALIHSGAASAAADDLTSSRSEEAWSRAGPLAVGATTPFDVTLTGKVNATGGMAYEHLSLPLAPGASALSPTRLPAFASGATLTFSSASMGACNFALCVTHLVQAVDSTEEWRAAVPRLGRSDVCEGYFNLSAGTASPHIATMQLTPGVTHFSVAARPAPPALHFASGRVRRLAAVDGELLCDFSIQLTGDACADGSFGPSCVVPSSTSASQPAVTQLLPADPPTSVALFEVHPNEIYSAALSVNVSSSGGDVSVFVHEGDAPSLSGTPIDPLNDFNITRSLSKFQLFLPAYRVQDNARRYFLGVTRTGAQADAPVDTQVSVRVTERACPPGYKGVSCEFYVPYILDPFDLSRTTIATIPSTSFQWNAARTEIWALFGLLFLEINPASNFSIGMQALDGQPLPALYMRMGQIPTLSAYDMKSSVVGDGQALHWLSSGATQLHDAIWYVGINVPVAYSRMGSVAMWINTPCPGTTSTVRADGTTVVTECSGRGVCLPDSHQCKCSGRYTGFDCMAVDSTMGLSSGARALIIVGCVVGTLLFGYLLCWWFSKGMERRSRPMAHAGYGHQLDEGGPAGGGGGGGRGGGGPGNVNRPPMGRI